MQTENDKPDILRITEPNYCVTKPNQGGGEPLKVITGEQLLLGKKDSIPFLLDGLLQSTGLACLAGSSDTGKSCLLRQLAIAVATGAEMCFGFKLNTMYKSSIYVATEDGRDATAFLLSKQAQMHRPAEVSSLRFLFDYEDLLVDLDAALTQKPADLVIIDCFQDAYGGDLKDTQRIRLFLGDYQRLAEQHQCLFLFLHHTGKRSEDRKPSKNNLLSGQGLEAKMRLVIELRADVLDSSLRHLCIVKGNYLSGQQKKDSFVLGFDENAFTFRNTGERTSFEELVRQEHGEETKYGQVTELRQQGYTIEKISDETGIPETTVRRILKKTKKSETHTDDEMIG